MANPVVITRQTRANDAAARFRAQYAHMMDQAFAYKDATPRAIADALDALGPTPDPDAVNAIIGRDWTTPQGCDGCGARVERVVRVGAEEDYESATAVLCGACLLAALKAYRETP